MSNLHRPLKVGDIVQYQIFGHDGIRYGKIIKFGEHYAIQNVVTRKLDHTTITWIAMACNIGLVRILKIITS